MKAHGAAREYDASNTHTNVRATLVAMMHNTILCLDKKLYKLRLRMATLG